MTRTGAGGESEQVETDRRTLQCRSSRSDLRGSTAKPLPLRGSYRLKCSFDGGAAFYLYDRKYSAPESEQVDLALAAGEAKSENPVALGH